MHSPYHWLIGLTWALKKQLWSHQGPMIRHPKQPVVRLEAPGPEVATQTAKRPVNLA